MTVENRIKAGLVSSHGGHLTELLELTEAFAGFDVFHWCYDADTARRLPHCYLVPNRPYSPLAFAANLVRAWRVLRRERPAALVSTGAEIAIAPFLAARLLGIPTLYIECGCQVATPSLTGRILVRVASRFFVQWPELLPAYSGRARYAGSLIAAPPEPRP